MTENNLIYTTVDNNYEKYARACFMSMKENYPNHPDVHVYCNRCSEEFLTFIKGLDGFSVFHEIPLVYEGSNLGPVNNPIVYNRYVLWTDYYKEWNNILHLDVDTIILGSLKNLFNVNEFTIFDNYDNLPSVEILKSYEGYQNFNKEYGTNINSSSPMCNAGIFIIPPIYRNKNTFRDLVNITNEFSDELNYADQSAINLWLYKNNMEISTDLKYNCQPHFLWYNRSPIKYEDVKIMHFAARKPDTIQFNLWWRIKNPDLIYNLYNKYLGMSYE